MARQQKENIFHFTRKEKNGILVIIAAVLLFTFIPFFYSLLVTGKTASKDLSQEIATLKLAEDSNETAYRKYPETKSGNHFHAYPKSNQESMGGELFYFDPNTISAVVWQQLGAKEKTAMTIVKYISKGGKFRSPDDLKKIWGLSPKLVERLLPYVRIEAPVTSYQNTYSSSKTYERKAPVIVDINSADSSQFVALPGIGPGFTKRILKFRDRLGGFYSIDQVAETFGLPDSVFQKIKPLLKIDAPLKKIQLNQVSQEQLKDHPYIRYQLGNAIFQYRTQHGDFKNIEDLKKIMIVTDEIFNKIAPYLTVE